MMCIALYGYPMILTLGADRYLSYGTALAAPVPAMRILTHTIKGLDKDWVCVYIFVDPTKDDNIDTEHSFCSGCNSLVNYQDLITNWGHFEVFSHVNWLVHTVCIA